MLLAASSALLALSTASATSNIAAAPARPLRNASKCRKPEKVSFAWLCAVLCVKMKGGKKETEANMRNGKGIVQSLRYSKVRVEVLLP
jgi:hypothetical protein